MQKQSPSPESIFIPDIPKFIHKSLKNKQKMEIILLDSLGKMLLDMAT